MHHLLRRRAFSVRAVIAAIAALAFLPSAASAQIGITKFFAGPVAPFNNISGLPLDSSAPTDPTKNDVGCGHINPNPDSRQRSLQAGAITDYCVSFSTDITDPVNGEDIDHTLVQLPVGTYGQIDAAAKCTLGQFGREDNQMNACPGNSQIGTGIVQIVLPTGVATPPTVTKQAPARIYALTTPSNQASKLGVALLTSAPSASAPTAPVLESKFYVNVTQNGSPTVGLLNDTDRLARSVPNPAAPSTQVPIAIQATSLRFWGSAAAHPHVTNPLAPTAPVTMNANFMRVATTCATPQTPSIAVFPYSGDPTVASNSYNLTGCEQLGFSPSFQAGMGGEVRPGGHPEIIINIAVPEGDQDLLGTRITLPQGVVTDLSRTQGACPVTTFTAGQCPASDQIGVVGAKLSGILGSATTGAVYKVQVPGQTLPAVGLDFNGPRLPLRVYGTTTLDGDGRIVNTFANLPSLAQRALSIQLFGGDRGILKVSDSLCRRSAFEALLTGQAGRVAVTSTARPCYAQGESRIVGATTSRPRLYLTPMAATGKRMASVEVTLPPGLTWATKRSQSGIRITRLQDGVTGDTNRWRRDSKSMKFTFPKEGTNTAYIITRSRTLVSSKRFRGRETPIDLKLKVVHTDGSREEFTVPIKRDER